MMSGSNVGARIRFFRQSRGWSQEELAASAGLSPRTISDLERGLRLPGYKTLVALARAVEVSVDRFFDEDCRQASPETLGPRRAALRARLLHLLNDADETTLEIAIAQIEALRRFNGRDG